MQFIYRFVCFICLSVPSLLGGGAWHHHWGEQTPPPPFILADERLMAAQLSRENRGPPVRPVYVRPAPPYQSAPRVSGGRGLGAQRRLVKTRHGTTHRFQRVESYRGRGESLSRKLGHVTAAPPTPHPITWWNHLCWQIQGGQVISCPEQEPLGTGDISRLSAVPRR